MPLRSSIRLLILGKHLASIPLGILFVSMNVEAWLSSCDRLAIPETRSANRCCNQQQVYLFRQGNKTYMHFSRYSLTKTLHNGKNTFTLLYSNPRTVKANAPFTRWAPSVSF